MKKTTKIAAGIMLVLALILSSAGCASVEIRQETAQLQTKDQTQPEVQQETGQTDGQGSMPQEKREAQSRERTRSLREAVASPEGLGAGAVMGACLGSMSIKDQKLFETAMENFNAITLENELKPDALFGYNNDSPAAGSIHEEELNGEKIMVPGIDHSRADAMLDRILEWNENYPDKAVRVRGHVLVWHSQTPEWFFHEDYDKDKDYVTKEVMDKRLEWYISSVLGYYTGEESRYSRLFYGWDVVNEAVSDRTGKYRTDTEAGSDSLSDSTHSSKSSWWKVYGDEGYIASAFRYANRYAPEGLDLYYNDYNECDDKKLGGIIALIRMVKAAEGTRIDGFGMQGHYSVNSPVAEKIESAARAYAGEVDKVMLTELDVKPSMLYDGTEEGLEKENIRQAKYYGSIYDIFKKLASENAGISGISLWGVSDKYTWLEGKHPLLFDEELNPKPAYDEFLK